MRELEQSDIAIIGMGCHFPKAPNLGAFWNLLISGGEGLSMVGADRVGFEGLAPQLSRGGFIEHFSDFDAAAFGISPREAKKMDPQQGLILEVAREALQDAHITPNKKNRSKVGVLMGVMGSEWGRFAFANPKHIDAHTGMGNGYAMIPNRLSYLYNWSGPSMAIDTACSSALVAVDVARRLLLSNEIDIAVVGGVNFILTPALSVFYQKAGLLSATGKCQPFGSAADGMVRGEGAGVLILKRYEAALRDQDRVYALIKGVAVNHDGRSNGMSAPNKWAQIEVIESTLEKSGISAESIDYVEAHGTGTLMGDPIEATALGEVIGKVKKAPLYVGSVKSNIGHLEGAAGIAGLIKASLSIYHRKIPASLHVGSGNRFIAFDALNLTVPDRLIDWRGTKRYAGVSAFGLGGTNAHVVLESVAPDFSGMIQQIVAEVTELPLHQVHLDSHFIQDLGFDSFLMMEFKHALETRLDGINQLDFSNLIMFETVRDVLTHLKRTPCILSK